MKKSFLIAVTLSLTPSLALALDESFDIEGAIGLQNVEVSHTSVSGDHEGITPGDLVFTDLAISDGSRVFSADYLTVREDGGLTAFLAEGVTWSIAGRTSGSVRSDVLRGNDIRALHVFFEGQTCSWNSSGVATNLFAEHVSFLSDPDMLPKEMPVEKILMDTMGLAIVAQQSECPTVSKLRAEAISMMLEDGASGRMSMLDVNFDTSADGGILSGVDVNDLRMTDSEGTALVSLGSAHLGLSIDGGDHQGSLSPLSVLSGWIVSGVGGDGRIDASFTSLDMPIGEIFPDRISDRLGLAGDERASGHGQVLLSQSNGVVTLDIDADIEGLGAVDADATLKRTAEVGALPGMSDPRLAALASLEFQGGSIALAGKGIGDLIARASGQPAEQRIAAAAPDIVAQLPASLRPALEPMVKSTLAWIGSGVTGKAAVEFAPAAPVGAAQVGMVLALNPASLPDLMGLSIPQATQ